MEILVKPSDSVTAWITLKLDYPDGVTAINIIMELQWENKKLQEEITMLKARNATLAAQNEYLAH